MDRGSRLVRAAIVGALARGVRAPSRWTQRLLIVVTVLIGAARGSRVRLVACLFAVSVTLAWWLPGSAAAAWSTQPTPSPKMSLSSLVGVSCASLTACTAVGDYFGVSGGEGPNMPLAERWDGTRWSIQRLANAPPETFLNAVSCSSQSACTAVGQYVGPLAERWDGTRWSIQPTPSPATAVVGFLKGVSCPSASSCTAVGYYDGADSAALPLAEHWDGIEWSIQPTPSPAATPQAGFAGVSCASPTACTAVGWYYDTAGAELPLAERWDGTRWSIDATPNPAGSNNSDLSSVSCPSPTACTAVGEYDPDLPLVERWDGASWSIQQAPSAGANTFLDDVSCPSASACTAVGHSSTRRLLLAERWDGIGWSVEPTSVQGGLAGVSCVSAAVCTAVGGAAGAHGGTLAARWHSAAVQECLVPKVKGKSFSAARRAIRAAHCRLGKVKAPHKPTHNPGKHKEWKLIVGTESPRAGSAKPSGTRVNLTLVYTGARQ